VSTGPAGPSVVWFELWVADVERSKRWYGDLFGWAFVPMSEYADDYWQIDGIHGVGGALVPGRPGASAGGAVVYFEVVDLEETIGRVVRLGGSVEKERTAIGLASGWFAIVQDPDGLRIGLWTGSGRA
jgi:uncharacterized protein